MAEEFFMDRATLEPVKNMENLQRVYHKMLYAAVFAVYLHPVISKPTPGSSDTAHLSASRRQVT